MTIRIRPSEIDVPEDDPFQNDLLDRKPSIEALTGLLGGLEGPCVLALDSQWGGGKTTFLRIWVAYLRGEGYPIAEFNAWETDFFGDPFVALSSRLQVQFEAAPQNTFAETSKLFAKAAKKVALRTAPVAIRILSQGLLESGSLEQLFSEQIASYAENRLEEYAEVEKSVIDFKEILQEGARRLSEQHDNRPLFIMIDELDRCRPSYAVELLETAKHLFSVDRIIFVLAVNRSELTHSVKALYGSEFDAQGYLQRFFDLDYRLPTPNRHNFALQLVRDAGLEVYFPVGTVPFEHMPAIVARLLDVSNLDLRRMVQTVRRMTLICNSLEQSLHAIYAAVSVGVVLRMMDAELYNSFLACEISDHEVVDRIYQNAGSKDFKDSPEGHVLEAVVCMMWYERYRNAGGYEDVMNASQLLTDHTATLKRMREAQRSSQGRRLTEEERELGGRAQGVMNVVSILRNDPNIDKYKMAFKCVEMLPYLEKR